MTDFVSLMLDSRSIGARVAEIETRHANMITRSGDALELLELGEELRRLAMRLSLYDYRAEGTPAGERSPRYVRSTEPLECVEIAPGLYAGRDDREELKIIDADYHRGYVTPWATPAKPNGYRVHTWSGRDRGVLLRRDFKRVYPDRRAAERALIREARRLQLASATADAA
jgi:hypothetical protein